MTTQPNELSLSISKVIQATPDKVYAAWLDPRMLAQFMTPGPNMTCPQVETDPRVGGAYKVVMRDGETDIPHHGTYLELTPYSRIAFTWNSPHAAPDSEVHLTFAPEGDGTKVELTHVKFKNEDSLNGHKAGWTGILEALAGQFA